MADVTVIAKHDAIDRIWLRLRAANIGLPGEWWEWTYLWKAADGWSRFGKTLQQSIPSRGLR